MYEFICDFVGAGSVIIAIIIGIVIGYFIGSGTHSLNLQSLLSTQSNPITTSQSQTQSMQRIFGSATSISTSGNGGTATILTSSAGTQVNITWSSSEVSNPSSYLSELCSWSLSGSTLVSINCSA